MSDYNFELLVKIADLEKKYGDFEKMPPEIKKEYRELQNQMRFEE